jgi:hypothetical protein
MTEEKEPAASPSDTVLDTTLAMGKGSIGPLLDFGKQEWYISALQELAAKLTIVDGGGKNEEIVVRSPHIRSLMKAYQFYGSGADGIVVVACSPQDSGKIWRPSIFCMAITSSVHNELGSFLLWEWMILPRNLVNNI